MPLLVADNLTESEFKKHATPRSDSPLSFDQLEQQIANMDTSNNNNNHGGAIDESSPDEERVTLKNQSQTTSFIFFNFIVAPIFLFALCFFLGGILSVSEGWSWMEGFYFISCDITGIGPFFTPETKLSLLGEIIEIIISVIALTCSSAIIGLAALLSLSCNLPQQLGIIDSPSRGALTILVFIPGFVLGFCFLFGGLFAWGEDWPLKDGFKFLVQTVCGLAAPITNVSPSSEHAKMFALVIAIASLGITSVIVGLVGSMAICEETVDAIEVQLGLAVKKTPVDSILKTNKNLPSKIDERMAMYNQDHSTQL